MEKNVTPWTMAVAVQDIPETGLHLEIEAPQDALAALAQLANVREVKSVVAVFDLTRRGAGVLVVGWVKAHVGQTCVVTLEPMSSEIEEPIDLLFSPGAPSDSHEIEVAAADEEPPEPLVDGKVDLAAIATEFLLLGIDPYPRKPGVEFSAPKADDGGAHPFAVLEALKKRPRDDQS